MPKKKHKKNISVERQSDLDKCIISSLVFRLKRGNLENIDFLKKFKQKIILEIY